MPSFRPRFGVKIPTYRSWTFVVIVGLAFALVALVDRGNLDLTHSDGSTGCRLEVTSDQVNLRAGPDQATDLLGTLERGTLVDGTSTVTDGFRELEDGRWVADRFLTPVPGTDCR